MMYTNCVWEPKEWQVRSCSHEENNIYDIFAIKTCLTDENGKEQIVGHLPLELPRFTKYLLDRGAVVTAKLTSVHYRRSVLVQGGIEIPCQVKAEMIATEKNKRILAHYLDLGNKNYKDFPPEKEIIVGSFLASENSQESEASNSVQISVVKRPASRKKEEPVSKYKNADIRKWLKKKETSIVV